MRKIVCVVICIILLLPTIIYADDLPVDDAIEESEVMLEENAEQSIASLDLSGLNLSAFTTEQLVVLRDLIEGEFEVRGYKYYSTLKLGDKGTSVTNLQERLATLGYFDGKKSGTFGAETQKAFQQFEAQNNLEIDGTASNEDQNLLFSKEAKASTGELIDIGDEKKVIVVAKASDETETDEEHADYGKYDYTEFFRYPENHYGEKVKIVGSVVQVVGSRTLGYQLRVSLNNNSSNIVYVYVFSDPGYNILEKDKLVIYGIATGTVTYETIFGGEVTLPGIVADEIVLQ